MSTWRKVMEAATDSRAKPIGVSPGGAAVQLGCSRQAVHKLIRRGRLDVTAVYEGTDLSFYLVHQASIDAYKAEVLEAVKRRFAAAS